MYVITYVRSCDGKPRNEAQQEGLIQALSSEYDVVGCYGDAAAGSSTQRPGLGAALGHLATGGIDALCVTSLERLTRRADQLEAIQRWCSERGFVIQEVPDIPASQ